MLDMPCPDQRISFVSYSKQALALPDTVNSETFARTLFSRNFAYAKFREKKALANWQNHSVVY